jgi:hypothetical protein
MNIEKIGPDRIEDDIRRIARYEGWCNRVENADLEDDEAASQARNNQERGTIIVRPLRVA